jgi:hypothetical protein
LIIRVVLEEKVMLARGEVVRLRELEKQARHALALAEQQKKKRQKGGAGERQS